MKKNLFTIFILVLLFCILALLFFFCFLVNNRASSERPSESIVLNELGKGGEIGMERDENRLKNIEGAWWHETCVSIDSSMTDVFLFGEKEKRLVIIGVVRSIKQEGKWIINFIGVEDINYVISGYPDCLPDEIIR